MKVVFGLENIRYIIKNSFYDEDMNRVFSPNYWEYWWCAIPIDQIFGDKTKRDQIIVGLSNFLPHLQKDEIVKILKKTKRALLKNNMENQI